MAFHLREMIYHPDHLLRWGISLFAAYGAFLCIAFQRFPKFMSMDKNAVLIHLLSVSILTLSFLGGMDYTRLIFLGFPFVIISILKIGNPKPTVLFLAFLLSLLLARFWEILPVIEIDLSPYNAWMPETSDSTWLTIWFLSAFLFYVIILIGRKILTSPASSRPSSE